MTLADCGRGACLRPANGLIAKLRVVLGLALTAASLAALAEPATTITVQTRQTGPRIHPHMWGIFFEDINFGADGGLYAELVKNRSFEFPDSLMGWGQSEPTRAANALSVQREKPLTDAQPHYLRVRAESQGRIEFWNEGFRGIGVKQGEKYVLRLHARSGEPSPGKFEVALVGPSGQPLDRAEIEGFKTGWQEHRITLRPTATEAKARLSFSLAGPGTLDLDQVSLFPEDTWNKRTNGLRADLVQMLADLRPGFMRFPGGCIVEGHYLTNRYQWKNTIGSPADRPLMINRWNREIKHRPTPDYYQSFGLGFYEYFVLCEDIGASPLPILNCGMACQFNSNELVPLDQLDPYIQDALDLIEFANGPVNSPWGSKRAAMGHPKPFHLKMLGIGNEQWGPQYIERYERFARVLKIRHPEIRLVSSAGPDPSGEKFDFLWPKLRALDADLVDEHYYRPPQWFLENAQRYDKYDRHGPQVFAGEYAAQSVKVVSPDNRNNWECALAEAAALTGFERNADVVRLSSYAPLFAHEEAWQWRPNLIWFDNLTVYGTPSYYVQQLFSRNRGDAVVPVEVASREGATGAGRVYASATRDETDKEIILKVVNARPEPLAANVVLAGARRVKPQARAIVLAGSLSDENSLREPRKVAPREQQLAMGKTTTEHVFPPNSVTVLRVKVD